MFRTILAAVLMTAAFGAAAAQTVDTPSSARGAAGRRNLPVAGVRVIERPDWVSRPTGQDVARYYPPIAQIVQLAGSTLLECTVTIEGAVENCRVTAETPLGLGFGDASLRMASLFKMKPQIVDGAPVEGAVVRIPVRFGGGAISPPAPAPAGAAPSPSALALAEKLTDHMRLAGNISARLDTAMESARAALPPSSSQADAEAQALALDLAGKSVEKFKTDLRTRIATIFAQRMPEADLAAIVAFFETPAGQTLASVQRSDYTQQWNAVYREVNNEVTSELQTAFCAKVDCGTQSAQSASAQGASP